MVPHSQHLRHPLIPCALVRSQCTAHAKRQRTVFGTVRLRDCRFAVIERARRPLLYLRLRCNIHETTPNPPISFYNFWNSRRYRDSWYIIFYCLVIALEPVKDRRWTQSEESRASFGTDFSHGNIVLCIRQATMAEVPAAPGC